MPDTFTFEEAVAEPKHFSFEEASVGKSFSFEEALKSSNPSLKFPLDKDVGLAEELARPTTEKLPSISVQEELGRIRGQPSNIGEWVRFIGGGVLHPIRQAETAIETTLTQLGLAKPEERLAVSPSKAMEQGVTLPTVPKAETVPGQLAAGTANAVVDLAQFFMTPEGLMSLGLGAVKEPIRRAVLLDYAGQMAINSPEQFAQAYEAYKRGDYQTATRSFIGGSATAAFSGMLAKHGAFGAEPAPIVKVERVAPSTAEALKQQSEILKPSTTGEPSAIQEQVTDAGVLRKERSEVGLPQVGEGNAKPEVVAPKVEATPSGPEAGPIAEPVKPKEVTENAQGQEAQKALLAEGQKAPVEEAATPAPEPPAPRRVKPERGLPESATKTDLMADMTEAGRAAFNEAKAKPDEFSAVDVSNLSSADRRNLARLGLSISIDRNQRILATYPAKLRAEDLRSAVQQKKQTVAGPQRVQLKKSPQTYTVLEELPRQPSDLPTETFYRVKNERTGEEITVESKDLKQPKKAKVEPKEQPSVEAGVKNPASDIIPEGFVDFDFLESKALGLVDAPKNLETIPSGDLPKGTVFKPIGKGYHGNPPTTYAFTPDGRVYDNSNRGMTHGGLSPWYIRYVTKWFNPEVPSISVGPGAAKLGIAPGADAFKKVFDYFKPPPDEASPAMVVDTASPLPDLQPKEVANQVFSKPFGVEKIPVLGRLFGGRARIRTPKDQAVATWFAERHGVGPAVASSVGQELGGKVNEVFKVDADGNLNVIPLRENASLKTSDVFEHLEDYALTDQQQAVYDSKIKPILERSREMANQYDLLPTEFEGDYFPRIVTERPAESQAASMAGGKRVGAKQAFQKDRAFDTEAEGWQKGYKYERDIEKRLVTRVEQLYKAVADKRLATDPVLEGRTRQGLIAELKDAYAEELGSGEMTEAKIERIADGLQAVGTVWQPGFFGKIFDAETANMLNREFGREQSSIRRTLANANDFIKATALGFDIGVGQIQLLATAFRNPAIWAKAQGKSIATMFNPEVWNAYAEANKPYIRELAQHGASIGRLPEMVSGLSGGVVKSIPGLREVAKPFARQFQTALDVAKVELWKAWRDITPREEHHQLVQALESQLLTARMESAMVPHGRSLAERVLFLAPSYYRGAVNLVASLGAKGVSGKVARQSLGSFMAGSVALYYAVGLSSGMKMEDLNKRMNPARPDFMLWDIEVGGQKMSIGIGGIFRSIIRLAGNMVKTSIETPGDWKTLSSEKNPLSRWYRGHAGPAVGIIWDQITGKDFLGNPVNLTDIPRKSAPLWMQDMVESQGNLERMAITVPSQFIGLNAVPTMRDIEQPFYFQMKDKIKSRVGYEEYLNNVARQARLLSADKRGDYVMKRIKDDEVAPKYREDARRKIFSKIR